VRAASDLGRRLLRAAFPQDCVLCAAPSGDEPLCTGCRRDLPSLGESCPRCAMPSPGGQVCGACLRDAPAFDRTVAVLRYAPSADRLVHAFKYRGRLALARYFAHELARRIDPLPAVDVIVPMPLAPRRLAERGFNQALEIARHLGRLTRIPVARRAARRARETADQTGLAPEERARNVRGAFACDAALAGRRIAVVDDVMTTGASLDELARTLRRAGALHIENWVVARTIPDA